MVVVLGMWPSCPLAFAHRRSSRGRLLLACWGQVPAPPPTWAAAAFWREIRWSSLTLSSLPCPALLLLSQAEGMLP